MTEQWLMLCGAPAVACACLAEIAYLVCYAPTGESLRRRLAWNLVGLAVVALYFLSRA